MQVAIDKAFNKAKIALMSIPDSTFLSTILFSLDFKWDSDIPTAATNGVKLLINPDWFGTLTEKARVGLIAHEAWHVAFNHMLRGSNLDHVRFNKAADYVINNMLLESGYELPPNGLNDPAYEGMSTEQVYAVLPVSDPTDTYDCDIELSDEDDLDTKAKVEDIILKAAQQSKMNGDSAGNIPAEIQALLEERLNPKLPWNILLQNYMSEYAKEDYSYRIPNRKYFPDLYIPSMYSESIANIAIAVDTSGSVSDADFAAFTSEIEDIRVTLNPKLTTVVGFDTRISSEVLLTESDSIDEVKFTGRGGTNLQPVFEYFKTKPPTVLIVFSDLYCYPEESAPDYDVIWICINNPNASVNFGTLIHLSL